MFLGTHTPRLDEKGRLILPAKFRDELAGGVVITKGQERCLYVFPMPEFQRIAGQLREQPMTHKAARAYGRVFFASATTRSRTSRAGSPSRSTSASTRRWIGSWW